MPSIETFTKRLNGILDSIGSWYERVLKEDEEYEEYCYHNGIGTQDSWIPPEPEEEEPEPAYDDTLVAKAAEEYPAEWVSIDESYTRHDVKCVNKFDIKKDASGDLFIKIIQVDDKHFESYVDTGKTYLAPHLHNIGSMSIWEIPPELMKRSSSQFLIYYESDHPDGPYWSVELDF